MKRGSTCSPDEPPAAPMRGRWRYPGVVPHVAALMRATGAVAEMAEGEKKPPILSYAIALPLAGMESRIMLRQPLFGARRRSQERAATAEFIALADYVALRGATQNT
jgi:hypothetical protein